MKANSGIPSQTMELKIVTMDSHFLYIPLFYAESKNYFGLLPPNYKITIIRSSERTDSSAFSMLMDTTSNKHQTIDFAVCDPACVLEANYGAGPFPVVLAELISNTAFWAIDRTSPPTSFLKDLERFTSIIAFHPGTTSYGIAKRISRRAGRKQTPIKSVFPNEELHALRASDSGTVALSPDILGIDDLLANFDEFKVYLALGTTREYNSVLLTGLMTRDDVVRDHRDLVVGILTSLQQAMVLIKQMTPEVVTYANLRFSGYGEDQVVRAFKRAEEGNVFPSSIEVREAHWMNSAQVAADAKNEPFDQVAALGLFHKHIAPYAPLAQQAKRDVYARIANALRPSPKPSFGSVYGLPVFWLTLGAVSAFFFHWYSTIAIILALTVGTYIARFAAFPRRSSGLYFHWASMASIVILAIGGFTYQWKLDLVLGLMVPIVLFDLAIVHAETKKK
jgi:hypothetical protein